VDGLTGGDGSGDGSKERIVMGSCPRLYEDNNLRTEQSLGGEIKDAAADRPPSIVSQFLNYRISLVGLGRLLRRLQ
jgi:hypothetical protein